MADREIEQVISAINKFPSKITSSDGRKLKKFFEPTEQMKTTCENIKSLRFKYRKKINDQEYLLLEEYLFNERETILDIKHAITVNYYLNRKQ
jgi:hypothetical protein